MSRQRATDDEVRRALRGATVSEAAPAIQASNVGDKPFDPSRRAPIEAKGFQHPQARGTQAGRSRGRVHPGIAYYRSR